MFDVFGYLSLLMIPVGMCLIVYGVIRDDENWADRMIGCGFASVAAGVFVFLVVVTVSIHKQYSSFMEECLRDHKKYECTTMWRTHTSIIYQK